MDKNIYTIHQLLLQRLLKDIRVEAGLRQSDLAERLNEPQSFVSKYENGERRIDVLELRAICKATGISLTEFFRRLEKVLSNETRT
jgi:transcriptional regulator with XRE-family HTH domain